MGLEPTTFR